LGSLGWDREASTEEYKPIYELSDRSTLSVASAIKLKYRKESYRLVYILGSKISKLNC
jgi:hypothetical protein